MRSPPPPGVRPLLTPPAHPVVSPGSLLVCVVCVYFPTLVEPPCLCAIAEGSCFGATCAVECLKAIKKHAFASSDYPVIITIENHCKAALQDFMAKDLLDILGYYDKVDDAGNLVPDTTRPLLWAVDHPNSTTAAPPSPEEAKGRILLRDKVADEKAKDKDSPLQLPHNQSLRSAHAAEGRGVWRARAAGRGEGTDVSIAHCLSSPSIPTAV